ncbi:aspartyl/asparaginyl beta-hydroxylase domain-containing protein [Kribbella sp. CA-253562]|uniref:aspartyl/asparaginyl beta-hydroxylase domain-containing protein n=1 Tax=Kribbella sp. CA-253562 TaxID=3239942 RepID=UPI003D8CC17A
MAAVSRFSEKLLRGAIQWLEPRIGKNSALPDQPFFPEDTFPWGRRLEDHWKDIREELDALLAHRDALPNFQDISAKQSRLSNDDNWKTFFFAGYGLKVDANRRRCPRTAALIDEVPGLKTAFFSILGPGKHLPPHHGPYKGVVRYHLALKIPAPESACGITVGGVTAHWREGKSLVFDDTYLHEAWNKTEEDRVVLFVDVVRPLNFPYSVVNSVILWAIGRSGFAREAKNAHEAWEQKFESLRSKER